MPAWFFLNIPVQVTRIVPRRFIALLLLLWFPVQGWAALAMPVCAHASMPHVSNHGAGAVMAAAADGHHAHHAPESSANTMSGQCDHCAACHLSHSPTLTPQMLDLLFITPEQRAESGLIFYYQLFPEQPQRPPLPLV